MSTQPKHTWEVEYRGETATRRPAMAALLTLLHPTLGYLYVGQAKAAIGAGLFFLVYLAGFVTLLAVSDVLPVLPAAAFVFGWLLLTVMCLWGVVREARAEGADYVVRSFNHPVIYTLVFLAVGTVPVYIASHVATNTLYATVSIEDQSMYPTALPGDVLLVDRTAFWEAEPARGDLVVVSTTDRDGEAASGVVGRVIAKAGDQVKLDGDTVLVNEERLPRQVFDGDHDLEDPPGTMAKYIEMNDGNRYLIAGAAHAPGRSSSATITVADGSLLILGDNRAGSGVKGAFGAVSAERVIGQPRYVLYSAAEGDETSGPRWDRIGYRVR